MERAAGLRGAALRNYKHFLEWVGMYIEKTKGKDRRHGPKILDKAATEAY